MNYLKFLGKKFEHGGRGPEYYDCYGLVKAVCEEKGITIPEFTSDEDKQILHDAIRNGAELFEKLDKPEPWCLVAISLIPGWTTHVGVVVEDGQRFIHIMRQSQVTIERLDAIDWKPRIKGYYKWKNNTN